MGTGWPGLAPARPPTRIDRAASPSPALPKAPSMPIRPFPRPSSFSGLAALALAATLSSACAEVTLPNIFGSHMVLQQGQKNKVWGKANPGEAVTVAVGEQSHQATADGAGAWQVMLDPLPPGGPLTVTVKGTNTIALEDVLVGEVWICSGQSNMEWSVNASSDADLERAAAKHPQIRMIGYPNVGTQETVWTHPDSQWQVCTPETVGSWSAVGYFFGRQLHDTLDVPIGLINDAWGGSACEAWIDRDTIEQHEELKGLLDRWAAQEARFDELSKLPAPDEAQRKELDSLKRSMTGNARPGNIYHGILKSHLGYGIRGAIWYQGESNADRAYQYRDLFPLMIRSWREEWGQGDFPFYWVQLADFMEETPQPGPSNWAELREAQTMTLDKVSNAGQAVIIDIGEGKDIHPKNKVDVGRRLARLALVGTYHIGGIAEKSPRYKAMQVEGDRIVLTFDGVGGGAKGWRPFDVPRPRGFTVAGEDRAFVPATATIRPDGTIEVSSESVTDPVAVRYGWANNPVVNLYSAEGLPLTPFRTDDWPGATAGKQ